MNSRDYKIFRSGSYYHIYNRGDNRENIFCDSQDYQNFLKRLAIVMGEMPIPNAGRRGALRIQSFSKGSFVILAFCLMPNHFHILIKQNGKHSIGQLMSRVCTSYSKYFNRKYNRVGHVFQDIFKSKLIESDEYIVLLSAYIHDNPPNPFVYKYSSISEYLQAKPSHLCDPRFILSLFNKNPKKYKKFVEQYKRDKTKQLSILDLTYDV